MHCYVVKKAPAVIAVHRRHTNRSLQSKSEGYYACVAHTGMQSVFILTSTKLNGLQRTHSEHFYHS